MRECAAEIQGLHRGGTSMFTAFVAACKLLHTVGAGAAAGAGAGAAPADGSAGASKAVQAVLSWPLSGSLWVQQSASSAAVGSAAAGQAAAPPRCTQLVLLTDGEATDEGFFPYAHLLACSPPSGMDFKALLVRAPGGTCRPGMYSRGLQARLQHSLQLMKSEVPCCSYRGPAFQTIMPSSQAPNLRPPFRSR